MSHDFSNHTVAFATPWITIFEKDRWYALTSSSGVFGGGGIIMDSNHDIILVEIYRHPINKTVLEIPRGAADPEEGSLGSALREMTEETGIDISGAKIIDLGIVHPDDGILAYENRLCAAILPHPFGKVSVDEAEVQGYRIMSLPHLRDLVLAGEVNDSHTIVALLRLEAKLADGSLDQ